MYFLKVSKGDKEVIEKIAAFIYNHYKTVRDPTGEGCDEFELPTEEEDLKEWGSTIHYMNSQDDVMYNETIQHIR